MTVFIAEPIARSGIDYLTERGYRVVLPAATDRTDLFNPGLECDAMILRNAPCRAAELNRFMRLRVIARHGVGYDNVDVDRAAELGIWVTNTPEALSTTVAEHTIGLLIAVAKHIPQGDREVRAGNFGVRDHLQGVDLAGKTLGLVGIGRIGRAVAAAARLGLGMTVIAYDPYASPTDGISSTATLEELLERSDFVSIHVPYTPATAGLIGEPEIARMKPSSYLINTARGGIVREDALIAALQERRIAGAAVDVYENEPPRSDHPYFRLDSVILTPHSAALTAECLSRLSLHAAMSVHEVLSESTPRWAVNRPQSGQRVDSGRRECEDRPVR